MEKDLKKRTIVLILKKLYFDNDDALPFWDPTSKMKQKWFFFSFWNTEFVVNRKSE